MLQRVDPGQSVNNDLTDGLFAVSMTSGIHGGVDLPRWIPGSSQRGGVAWVLGVCLSVVLIFCTLYFPGASPVGDVLIKSCGTQNKLVLNRVFVSSNEDITCA